ncbi:hypothetical protein NFI96_000969 [Prochilodus magdalenae]|nr:hypothetical protein NFI96_000969 [Prochilodus magdalenae]
MERADWVYSLSGFSGFWVQVAGESCVVQPSADGAALTGGLMEDTTARWRSVMVVLGQSVVDMQGCCPYTRFMVPPKTTHWVALLQRGKCTFKEKILKAAAFNASAVLIYNNSSKEDTVTMAHEGQLRLLHLLQLEHPHTVPADGAVGVEVEGHQVFWTCDNKPLILVLTTVPPHTGSLGVSTKTKAGLVTEDDPLPF